MERVVKEKTFGLGSGKGRKYGSIPHFYYLLLSKLIYFDEREENCPNPYLF
jgi:hypothetical protein